MKTTIDIADDLLLKSKQVSHQRGITLRELVTEGLIHVVSVDKPSPFRVKPVTFKGRGLSPDFQDADWGAIRDATYKGHGA